MNEREFHNLIPDYLDGALPAGEFRAFEAEMAQSASLREEVQAGRNLEAMLAAIPSPSAPEGLRARIMQAVRAETPAIERSPAIEALPGGKLFRTAPVTRRSGPRLSIYRWTQLAAAAAGLLVGIGIYRSGLLSGPFPEAGDRSVTRADAKARDVGLRSPSVAEMTPPTEKTDAHAGKPKNHKASGETAAPHKKEVASAAPEAASYGYAAAPSSPGGGPVVEKKIEGAGAEPSPAQGLSNSTEQPLRPLRPGNAPAAGGLALDADGKGGASTVADAGMSPVQTPMVQAYFEQKSAPPASEKEIFLPPATPAPQLSLDFQIERAEPLVELAGVAPAHKNSIGAPLKSIAPTPAPLGPTMIVEADNSSADVAPGDAGQRGRAVLADSVSDSEAPAEKRVEPAPKSMLGDLKRLEGPGISVTVESAGAGPQVAALPGPVSQPSAERMAVEPALKSFPPPGLGAEAEAARQIASAPKIVSKDAGALSLATASPASDPSKRAAPATTATPPDGILSLVIYQRKGESEAQALQRAKEAASTATKKAGGLLTDDLRLRPLPGNRTVQEITVNLSSGNANRLVDELRARGFRYEPAKNGAPVSQLVSAEAGSTQPRSGDGFASFERVLPPTVERASPNASGAGSALGFAAGSLSTSHEARLLVRIAAIRPAGE